jgi:hypothetical protein
VNPDSIVQSVCVHVTQTIATSFQRKMMYAQDKECRDVVIKLVETDSVWSIAHTHASCSVCTESSKAESFPFIIGNIHYLVN